MIDKGTLSFIDSRIWFFVNDNLKFLFVGKRNKRNIFLKYDKWTKKQAEANLKIVRSYHNGERIQ